MYEPFFIVHKDPKQLIRKFVTELERRQKFIVKYVEDIFPKPDDFVILPDRVKKDWIGWVYQVPAIGFNSSKYDLDLIKNHFREHIEKAKIISLGDDVKLLKHPKVFAACTGNNYMFLTTSMFNFLDLTYILGSSMGYDKLYKSLGCKQEKLVLHYEWLTSYKKTSHVRPAKRQGT